ncbi:MAG: PIN domain-containing protein [Acidobacteriia bacterium]|nr:PIN domain-containing protein [Terriglobia bacterium]
MKVLVDTSVWSLALRRKARDLNQRERFLVRELTELVREGRAGIIGLIRQELLSGIKTNAQFEELRKALRAFPDEPVGVEDHEAAAKAGNACRAKGIAVSVVDILICAVARRRDMAVLTTDPDFNNYARELALKLHSARGVSGPTIP